VSSGISMQDTCSVFGVRCSILPTRTAKNTSLEKKKRLEVLQDGPGGRKHRFCRADVILGKFEEIF